MQCNGLFGDHVKEWNFARASDGVSCAIQKVKTVAQAIFCYIKEIILFPLRYFGSKSSYQFTCEDLTKEDLKPYLPHVAAAAVVHSCKSDFLPVGWSIVPPADIGIKDLGGGLRANSNCYFDEVSGLKIAISNKDNEVFITFGALHSSESELTDRKKIRNLCVKNHCDIVSNFLGRVPSIYLQAERFLCQLKRESDFLKDKKIILTGQCFGGSIAQFISLKFKDTPAVCFNSFPIGAGLQKEIDTQNLTNAKELVTHILVKGDYLTGNHSIGKIDWVMSKMGIKTPGLFGKKYQIPSAYTSSMDSHGFIVGSVAAHLGYDKRTLPKDMNS